MWQTLKDGSVDIDENNGHEGDNEELVLPVVGVDEGQRWRESELSFSFWKHCPAFIVVIYYPSHILTAYDTK